MMKKKIKFKKYLKYLYMFSNNNLPLILVFLVLFYLIFFKNSSENFAEFTKMCDANEEQFDYTVTLPDGTLNKARNCEKKCLEGYNFYNNKCYQNCPETHPFISPYIFGFGGRKSGASIKCYNKRNISVPREIIERIPSRNLETVNA
jgi:hypothetical protein